MHQTHNTLSENIRTQSVAALNKHLAAAIDLHGQIKQAHWNVRGPNFIAIHKLFDEVADTALEASDLLAERAAGLGGTAEGTVQVATAKSFLVPYEIGVVDAAKHFAQCWNYRYSAAYGSPEYSVRYADASNVAGHSFGIGNCHQTGRASQV